MERVREANASEISQARKIWRSITKKYFRHIGLLIIAIVIIILFLAININGRSGDAEVNAFAEIAEAMKKTHWVKVIPSKIEGIEQAKKDQVSKLWICPEAKIKVEKRANGSIYFYDFKANKLHFYNAKDETLTISSICKDDNGELFRNFANPFDLLDLIAKRIEQKSGYIKTIKDGSMEIHLGLEQGYYANIALQIDKKSKLITLADMKTNKSADLTLVHMTAHLEYPHDGPTDIYEMGIDEDVEIIDKL